MRHIHLITLLLVVLGLTTALSLQFFRSESEQTAQLSNVVNRALETKQLDTKLNEEALKAASFRFVHFDNIVQIVKATEKSRLALEKAVSGLDREKAERFHEALKNLAQVMQKRLTMIERLKSKVALSRNSSNFLLAFLRKDSEQPTQGIMDLAVQALNEIQGYQIFPTQERFEAAQKVLNELRQKTDQQEGLAGFGNVLRHMDMMFSITQEVSAIVDELMAGRSQSLISSLITDLQMIQVNEQNRSTGYRYLLLSAVLFVFVAFAYALVRWNQARRRTQQASQLFEDAVDSMSEGFAFFGPNQKLVFWNTTFARLYEPIFDRIHKDMSWEEFEAVQKESGFLLQSELQKDGSTLDQTQNGYWMLSANTKMHQGGYAVVRVDLSEQKRAQDQLQLAATVFQTASEAMMVTDKDNIIQMVNPAFSKITGYKESDVLGQRPSILSSGHHGEDYYQKMFDDLERYGSWQGEIWNRRKSGEIYPEWLSISTICDEDNQVVQRVSLFNDITSRKKSEERIHYQANYDSLTDLPNRNLFRERLNQSINMARRSKSRVAVLFLDIDNFKHINDTLGHLMGDELLRNVADRLRSLFRTSDTIARLSGDEFIVIINDANYDPDLEQLLNRLLECLSLPYVLDGNTAYTSVSVGATFFPDDGQSVDSLLQNADAAMFKAKEMGRNTYSFFTPEMNSRAQERHTMEVALHRALEKHEFVLHYQPIVDADSHTMVTTEALVRWNDPERGLIQPDKFIAVAEDTGLIVPMGEWILRQACCDAARWHRENSHSFGVSVNLSSRQFKRSDIYGLVKEVLAETGLPAGKLSLEITESLLVDDDSSVLKTLRDLRDLGVLLSIDDFGTGYSSLSYLKRFPITTLKIDRSFINDVLSNNEDAALSQAIISMAKSMSLKVVAEGVENAGQARFLTERKCDLIQGYFFSKPLPFEELMSAIASNHLNEKKEL